MTHILPAHSEPENWWASLKHGGMLIAPSKIAEYFPDGLRPLPSRVEHRLRSDIERLDAGDGHAVNALLDTVLEQVLGLGRLYHPGTGSWLKGPAVPPEWTHRSISGAAVKPRRVWQGAHGADFPVFFDAEPRIGIGRGRRSAAAVVEWLRRAGRKVALLTNGRQWRLIYAGIDHDAFAEADASLWFEEGTAGPQLKALRELLSPTTLTPPAEGKPPILLAAVEASRKGQAELSAELGERVRQAVELLIREHTRGLEETIATDAAVTPREIYLAATRVVMRMVVVLFAEARDLLPRDNPVYHASYGLSGLREMLDRAAGGAGEERLKHRWGAWPRVLALFRLVYQGSPHQALPVFCYGGGLFEPGDPSSINPLSRALAIFETMDPAPSDAVVHRLLRFLTRSRVKVRQGRGSTWVEAPVDFSDLSSEYIGILYEGLLDFELRRAAEADPIVFLALGDEPALPLSRLETMEEKAIKALVEKFKVKKQVSVAEDGEEGEEEEDAEEEVPEEDDLAEEAAEEMAAYETAEEETVEEDLRRAALERAREWAKKAVIEGKVVAKPRSRSAEAVRDYEQAVEQAAKGLVSRLILPGEWFLVRFGGTRKGSGTFYTRPQLAVPTTQRTLRPLAYHPPAGADGAPDETAPASAWTPKLPEEILSLKVCDPACGSGSFLVAALRFLTGALMESLHHHGRIEAQGERTLVTLAEGKPGGERLDEETLPCRPDAEDFEPRLAARLKRYVVERCVYGVDLDSLAVELARLSLWVETMDRSLPFSFLDHKVRCGNSLVGCWFDRFRDYPALAWEREGGDKGHTRGVHFEKEAWTKAIKEFRNKRVKPALADWIRGQGSLFEQAQGQTPEQIHDQALKVLEEMHALPVIQTQERAMFYKERILGSESLARLREAFDAWCALWFWPADRLEDAPLPGNFADPPESARTIVREIAGEMRFFHWELEFPDVFARPDSGFDAIVGNPPWETLQPVSREYFSDLDPLFRTYGKQEALMVQEEIFERSQSEERLWLLYNSRFKAIGNYAKNSRSPFGDGSNDGTKFQLGKSSDDLHELWQNRRIKRQGYADSAHPFLHQGEGKAYTYKMFLEASHALLRDSGHLGMIVPSGIYTDKGTTDLRSLFLMSCEWRWLFGFENRDKVFDIDSRFKFCPVIIRKGGTTLALSTAFMRRDLKDWEEAERHVIPYSREQVEGFSPKTRAILEIRERRDLEVLEKIYANSILLGDDSQDGWKIQYAQGDFNMTSDSHLFPPRPKWEEDGYRPDEYGRWLKGDWQPRKPGSAAPPDAPRCELDPGVILSRDGASFIRESDPAYTALPLYQGIMVRAFDPSAKGWLSGTGLRANWEEIPFGEKRWQPQYLMSSADWISSQRFSLALKVGYREVARTTDARSFIGAVLPPMPCGHKVPILRNQNAGDEHALAMAGLFNSFCFDWVIRVRLGAAALAWFVLEETFIPMNPPIHRLAHLVAPLNLIHNLFSPYWMRINRINQAHPKALKSLWALTSHGRLRMRCIADAIAAILFGLNASDLTWILRDCDHPAAEISGRSVSPTLDPKGFWRVDKDKDPELRHTVLTLAAFHDLKETIKACGGDRDRGIEAFCSRNGGEGWMLPEALCLADLGLGHDERAKKPQPVRSRLGERFLPWQLEQSVEDSWKECALHARNLVGADAFSRLQSQPSAPQPYPDSTPPLPLVAETPGAANRASQRSLFKPDQEDMDD